MRFSWLVRCALWALIAGLGAAPARAGVDEAQSRSSFAKVLARLGERAAIKPLTQAACRLRKTGTLSKVQSVGFHVTALVSQYFPGLSLTGFDANASTGFSVGYTEGSDHVEIQGDLIPSASFNVPFITFPGAQPWRLLGDPSIAFTWGCPANDPDPSSFAIGQFFGGLNLGLKYGINIDGIYLSLMKKKSDEPKTIDDFRNAARAAAHGFQEALASLHRNDGAAERRAAFPVDIPAFPGGNPDEDSHALSDLFEAVVEIATEHIDPARPSPVVVAENLLKTLAEVKREDAMVAARRAEEVQAAYLALGKTSQKLARAVFPVVMRKEMREFFQKVTEATATEPSWLTRPVFSGVMGHTAGPTDAYKVPVDRKKEAVLRNAALAITHDEKLRAKWCDGKNRFVAVRIEVREDGKNKTTKHYVDCATERTYPATAADGEGETYASFAAWIRAHRAIFIHAEALRWALSGYTHVVNNAYARWMTGQAIDLERLKIGGIHYDRPIFNGCRAVFMGVADVAMNVASVLGTAINTANALVTKFPKSLEGVGDVLSEAGSAWGGRTLSYGVGISHYYAVGPSFRVPLDRLPRPIRALTTGQCVDE